MRHIKPNDDRTYFTLIIPTRERSDTLKYTIENILSQEYDNFQLLISDNYSQDDTREVVESFDDTRIKYVNTKKRVSMTENWEFALSHVDLGWISVFGDDDGLLPGALKQVNSIICETGTKAIRSNGCGYQWPGFNGARYGSLDLSSKKGYEMRNSLEFLKKVMDGKCDYNQLPMLYNGGFISIDVVNKVKSKSNKVFNSITPDVYSAVAFSLVEKTYVYSHEPFAINGASLHSGGTAAFEVKKQTRKYDPSKKFFSENSMLFHKDIPLGLEGIPVRSIQVYVYEAFLQAKRYFMAAEGVTNHSRQLRIIFGKSGPDCEELHDWAKRFSALHEIDLPKGYKLDRLKFQARYFASRLSWAKNTHTLSGSLHNPIPNIAVAANIAGALKDIKPRFWWRVHKKIKKYFFSLMMLGKLT